MKKPSWKSKLQYRFDNLMSRGTLSMILLLFLITAGVVVVAGFISALLGGAEGGNPLTGMWISLMHAIDAGTLAGDSGSGWFLFLMALVTLCGMFFTSMLVGLISTGLEKKMDSLRKGHSQVLEKDHVLILGFSESTLNILRELIAANENQKDAVVVVMDDRDKGEMEDLIHQRIRDTRTTRIICRSGRIDSFAALETCSLADCRSIIINVLDDYLTIKAILACASILEKADNHTAYITALICEEEHISPARIAGGDRVEVLYFHATIARIMAHASRQPGMSLVFTDLLTYGGDEIYIEKIPATAGLRMCEVNLYFPRSTVIGVLRNGETIVNPPADTVITAEDELILIAEDDGVSHPADKPAAIRENAFSCITGVEAEAQHNLILRCNRLLPQVLMEEDAYMAPGSTVVVATTEAPDPAFLPEEGKLRNTRLITRCCDIFNRTALMTLLEETKPHSILLLTDPNDTDDEADNRTLLLLLNLWDIARKTGAHFTVATEMRSVESQELASVTQVTDFVISSNITAMMMTQISQNRSQHAILDELLDEKNSELYIKPASRYIITDTPVDFYTVGAAAARLGEVAIGYRKMAPDGSFHIVLNPEKATQIVLTEQDALVVIAED